MTTNPTGACVVAMLCLLLGACDRGDEARITSTVDELVDALNARDTAALAALFRDGAIAPVSAAGDSSVVYRLATIPGGGDFDAGPVAATVLGDRAQAHFDLSGKVERSDQVMGEMTLKIGVDLERHGEAWRIVPGSDRMLSTY